MYRSVGAVVSAALLVLCLPVPHAVACSPAYPMLTIDRDRLVPGDRVRVAGDQDTRPFDCGMPPLPSSPPAPSAGVTPDPDPGPSQTPLVGVPLPTTPAVVPPLARPPYAPREVLPAAVVVTISDERGYHGNPPRNVRELAQVAADPPTRLPGGYLRHTFSAVVTLPADLRPGSYVIDAHQNGTVNFGSVSVTVVATLPVNGSSSLALVATGLLALVAGAGAVVLGRRAGLSG